jgi:hypothetical protein
MSTTIIPTPEANLPENGQSPPVQAGVGSPLRACPACNRILPLPYFNPNPSRCKRCRASDRREYYRRNKEKVKERQKIYASSHRDEERERGRRWAEKNKEKIAEKNRRYYQLNADKCKERLNRWRSENKTKYLENQRKWRKENAEHAKEYERNYYAQNRQRGIEKQKKWSKANPLKVKATRQKTYQKRKPEINARVRAKRESDPQFAMAGRLRCRLRGALRSSGAKKSDSTMRLVGCTREFLVQHIESLFAEGMSWRNKHLWEIDHIIPCAAFDLTDREQQLKCFHYSNLQPLWAELNRKKGARININTGEK